MCMGTEKRIGNTFLGSLSNCPMDSPTDETKEQTLEQVLQSLQKDWSCGSQSDPSKVFVWTEPDSYVLVSTEMNGQSVNCLVQEQYVPTEQKKEKIVLLQTIFVPEKHRKHGWATRIVELLETRANQQSRRLVVGPIFDETEAMTHLLSNRKYESI